MLGRLGIFAKEPAPGHVKTRLAAETSPEFAAAVAAAFLDDTLARMASLPIRATIAFAPDEAATYFHGRAAAHGMTAIRSVDGHGNTRLVAE